MKIITIWHKGMHESSRWEIVSTPPRMGHLARPSPRSYGSSGSQGSSFAPGPGVPSGFAKRATEIAREKKGRRAEEKQHPIRDAKYMLSKTD